MKRNIAGAGKKPERSCRRGICLWIKRALITISRNIRVEIIADFPTVDAGVQVQVSLGGYKCDVDIAFAAGDAEPEMLVGTGCVAAGNQV